MAGSVKDVQLDNKIIDFEHFGEEVDACGGFGVGECVVDILVENGSLSGV